MKKTLVSTGIAAVLSLGVATAQAEIRTVDSWTLGAFNGAISDFAFGGVPTGPSPIPDQDNTFGPDPETGCTAATDGVNCDAIAFGQATGTLAFSTGFNFGGQGDFNPQIFGNIAGTIDTTLITGTNDGAALTFTALDFGGIYNGATFNLGPDTLSNCTGNDTGFFSCGQVAQADIDGAFGGYVGTTAGYNVLLTDNLDGSYGIELAYIGTIAGSGTAFDGSEANWRLRGTLQTSPVPVPAAAWLFGSGLLGLVGVARRRKSAGS